MPDALDELVASLTPDEHDALWLQARHDYWREGDLTYKLHDGWREIDAEIDRRPDVTRWVLEISRKWGKTFYLVTKAAMLCRRHRKARIVYGAPTLKHLEEFILPVLDEIAADAPEDIRPVYEPSSGHWFFPETESWVHFFGADDQRKADRGRGPKALAAFFDEAGFTPVLQYVISSVFRPSMLHGSLYTIVSSTPAPQPDHDFTRICEMAEANGALFHRDIYSNPLLTNEQIAKFIADDAKDNGMTPEQYVLTSHFRREYGAERVVDSTLMVMGDDWEHARESSFIEVPRPTYFDAYEVFDFGGTDPRAVLFGYWHFDTGTLVIEDEVNLRNNENTAQLADAAKEKETELYGIRQWEGTVRAIREEKMDERLAAFLPPKELERIRKIEAMPLQPYLRVCDHDVQTAIDLWTLHKLGVVMAEKGDLVSRVNEFRVALRMGKVRIDPRCRDLDRQLRTSEWTSPRATDFKRKNGEHADLLWCAITMWHNVRKSRNPAPPIRHEDPVAALIERERAKRRGLLKLASGRR